MYKNQLQEFAQRSCFNLPSYSCIREGPDHAPRFKSRVDFSGEIFESPNFFSTLRQAEHAAAEVALKTLSIRGPSKSLAARVLDETGVYKNLLQETAHRAGLKLPVYTTVRSGPGHFAVFTCTVDIAGMSFNGEPAKTKKQAQKSAAMAAWFALKNLSQGSSVSPLSDLGGKDEQEQITVARYLATLQSPRTNKLVQRDRHHEQQELASLRRDVIPYRATSSLYSMQHQSCTFSLFSPEVTMYQSWPQEQVSQQQSHLWAFPPAPTCVPRPRFFPLVQSISQPDLGSYFLAREQEPVPLIPGIGPILCFSNHSMPVQVKSNSQLSIQEIKDNTQQSPTEVSVGLDSLSNHSKLTIQDSLRGENEENSSRSAHETRNFSQWDIYQNEEFSWIPPGLSQNRPRASTALEARSRPRNSTSLSFVSSNVAPPNSHATGSLTFARDFVPPPSAPPVAVRTAGATYSGSFMAKGTNPLMLASPPTRIAGSVYSTSPWVEAMKTIGGGMPCGRSMAPPVQIRSVVPVCSAPSARRMQSPSQEGTSSEGERKRT